MIAKRCPDCRGMGYVFRNDVGQGCPRCEGIGTIPDADDIPPAIRAAVSKRSGGICEVCHRRPATDKHHRKYRSRSGLHLVENLLDLCGPGNVFGCHGDAHGPTPLEGVAISRYETRPVAEIEFVDKLGYRWRLAVDGTKARVGAPVELEVDPWAL